MILVALYVILIVLLPSGFGYFIMPLIVDKHTHVFFQGSVFFTVVTFLTGYVFRLRIEGRQILVHPLASSFYPVFGLAAGLFMISAAGFALDWMPFVRWFLPLIGGILTIMGLVLGPEYGWKMKTYWK